MPSQKRQNFQNKQRGPQREGYSYILFHKPFNVLCQFSPEKGKTTLADYLSIAKDIYPAGRLDYDSEGLLLLSNDNALKSRLLDPVFGHEREYLAFVDGIPSEEELEKFRAGLTIENYQTKPAAIEIADRPGWLQERSIPPRTYENKSYSWLRIILTEGKNRQVRKMTAAIGHPTLRLIRARILNITIEGLQPGQSRELEPEELATMQAQLSL